MLLAKSSPAIEAAQAAEESTRQKEMTKGLPKPVADALAIEAGKRNEKESNADHFRTQVADETKPSDKNWLRANGQRQDSKMVPSTGCDDGPPRLCIPSRQLADDSGGCRS
jgi:hypothetical protein